jgi:apolipoprotein D and lipocalin family protein
MKSLVRIPLCLSVLIFSGLAFAAETVPYVDVQKYIGRWYQIARNPMWFEPRNCVCAQQTLSLQDDGVLGVYNSCNDGSPQGPLNDIRGTATNDDPTANAKFTVDFGQPFKGSYWIIGLDADYRWAVVTDKWELSLYILSKTPELAPELYEAALASAASQVKTSNLLTTSHVGCSYPD